ncbi:probable basic-leucine zipper transcription factor G [Harmonia axyridis]|uniref:probable basic-leucine zipper transcription factor G n=1 Tax=Harmonia axyridis TaxID=115357 RepID=UPI001E275946|nr:probable basic-leucine zipper transcription factor G [Harmonia axyridis]XP_045482501.1 probable basic-leucine zipper transcription factor G [Harmonia axyridis]
MSFYDILGSDGEVNSKLDMDNIDMSIDYSTPEELLSSEFFTSCQSFGDPISIDHGICDNDVINFDDDINLLSETSSNPEEVFSPGSVTSESEKSSIIESADESVSSMANHTIEDINESLMMSLLNQNDNIKIINTPSKPTIPVIKQNKLTKIVVQTPNNNKKILVTKPIHPNQIKTTNVKPNKKILKVHNITSNGRSVLLPLHMNSFKILNASDLKAENFRVTSSTGDNMFTQCKIDTRDNIFTQCKIEPLSPETEDEVDVVSSTDSQHPALNLTNEERRLLSKEGIKLPTHYPLTKNEERELKRIRRKIRNKISAQDSRKRKKEYVDGLEERVKRSSEEKKFLLQRIKQLQRQNNKLMSHFSKLQELLFKSSTSKATPSTCVMVVLLSALLVSLPNIRLPQKEMNEAEQGARRALLSSQIDEDLHLDEFLVFKDDLELPSEMADSENITEKELSKMLNNAERGWNEKESVFSQVIENVSRWLGKDKTLPSKSIFAEPDIDDGPPLKRTRFDLNVNRYSAVDVENTPSDQQLDMVTTMFTINDSKKK